MNKEIIKNILPEDVTNVVLELGLNNIQIYSTDSCKINAEEFRKSIANIISMMYKLAEENKYLRSQNKTLDRMLEIIQKSRKKDYISKDKIKAKIEELEDLNSKFSQRVIKAKEPYLTEMVQNILKELLKEE